MADDADALAAETAETADDRGVIAELAVSGQRYEVGDQRADIVEAMGTLGVAGDLRLLPGRELRVEILESVCRLGLEAGDLLADRRRAVAGLERAQLLQLGLELGHRLFEVEVAAHHIALARPHRLWSSALRACGVRQKGPCRLIEIDLIHPGACSSNWVPLFGT